MQALALQFAPATANLACQSAFKFLFVAAQLEVECCPIFIASSSAEPVHPTPLWVPVLSLELTEAEHSPMPPLVQDSLTCKDDRCEVYTKLLA